MKNLGLAIYVTGLVSDGHCDDIADITHESLYTLNLYAEWKNMILSFLPSIDTATSKIHSRQNSK